MALLKCQNGNNKLMSWSNSLEHFIAVVDTGSFNKAAKHMHTTPSAVSKRVRWLEKDIKKRLLLRTTRTLTLTSDGKILYEKGKAILTQWQELKTQLNNAEDILTGELSLGIPRWSGDRYITQQVGVFLKQYPQLTIRTQVGHDFRSPPEEKLDIIFADDLYGKRYPYLTRKRLFSVYRQLYAAPSFLQTHPTLETLKDCEQHPILFREALGNVAQLKGETLTMSSPVICDDGDTLVKLAVQGLGLLYCSSVMLMDEVRNGDLVPVLPEYHSKPIHFYGYYIRSQYIPKSITLFLQALANVFQTQLVNATFCHSATGGD